MSELLVVQQAPLVGADGQPLPTTDEDAEVLKDQARHLLAVLNSEPIQGWHRDLLSGPVRLWRSSAIGMPRDLHTDGLVGWVGWRAKQLAAKADEAARAKVEAERA